MLFSCCLAFAAFCRRAAGCKTGGGVALLSLAERTGGGGACIPPAAALFRMPALLSAGRTGGGACALVVVAIASFLQGCHCAASSLLKCCKDNVEEQTKHRQGPNKELPRRSMPSRDPTQSKASDG